MPDIPEFADMVPDRETLDGDKIQIDAVLNVPLVFLNWTITASKYRNNGQDQQRLTLQFELDGRHRILFTSSMVLIEQITEYDRTRDHSKPKAFRATIRKIDKFYKLGRSS